MCLSRRDLAAAQHRALPFKIYRHSQIPYEGAAKKKCREFFHGTNHNGFALEMHETILGAVQIHALLRLQNTASTTPPPLMTLNTSWNRGGPTILNSDS